MDELNVQGTEQQEAAAQTAPTGAESENREEVKTFTQEEVDKIVEKRLNRERKKLAGVLSIEDPREAALAQRERAVEIKEMQGRCEGYPFRAWASDGSIGTIRLYRQRIV